MSRYDFNILLLYFTLNQIINEILQYDLCLQCNIFLGLNMFLVPINMSIFRFSPSKIFLQLIVLQKFSFSLLIPTLNVEFIFFNKIL